MSTLRVLIHDAWPDQPEAHWVVIDKGAVSASGHSAPAAWPRCERVEAVLSGTQVGWVQVKLPQARPREQLRALPFAIEEQLLREPDSQHFTPLLREEENWSVLVVARERMKRLTAQFQAIDRPLDAAWSALAGLPVSADAWTLAADAGHWLLRASSAHAIVDDAPSQPGELPPIIATSILQAQARGSLPARILAYGLDAASVQALQGAQLAVEASAQWAWHEVAEDAVNLLHGEFQSGHARSKLLRGLRPALWLIAVVLVLNLLLGVGSALLRQHELQGLRARMNELARTQLPGRALLDAPLQLHRELQSQRQRHGLQADDDMLALLNELALALGSDATNALQALHYDAGALVVTFAKPLDIAALQSRLETRGITASASGGTSLSLQRSAR
jgi:general secretion pathway protein L